jgi:hypothetical protein
LGKCVKIREIPVTIDANVRNFGTNRNMNYMHLLKIRDIPVTIAANATSGTNCTKIREKIRTLWLKYVNIRDIPVTIAANASSGTNCKKIRKL